MKAFLFITSFLLCSCVYSQNWNLINTGNKYNYSINSGSVNNYHTTVFVDSIFADNSDTIFFLNRIVTLCDTCPIAFGTSYLFYNQPTFLQRKVYKTNNIYTFNDTISYTVLPHSLPGQSWIFDTINNVTAEVIIYTTEYVFGIQDSVKYVKLSTNDTIKISENFGIIEFKADASLDNKYFLIGIENNSNSFGVLIPRFYDFFNFNIGDVFQYETSSCWWGNGGDCNHSLFKNTIISKYTGSDSIVYVVNTNGKYWATMGGGMPSGDTSYFNYVDTVYYVDSINNLANFYNNQLIREAFDFNVWYSKASVDYYDGLFLKKIGFDYSGNIPFYEIDTNYTNLLCNAPSADYYYRTLTTGLGQTSWYYLWFEASGYTFLIGYVKDGDTTGTVYPDYILSSAGNLYHKPFLRIYPNPSAGNINIEFFNSDRKENVQISIIDITGREIYKINTYKYILQIKNLNKGVYFLKVKSEHCQLTEKIVIN